MSRPVKNLRLFGTKGRGRDSVVDNPSHTVSKKIKKLKEEGKPQDQAVAIALDMKRRGELD